VNETQLKTNDPKARRILQGAARVFSTKGYHHASMRDIARETDVSLAGMYYYFESKEEMLYYIQRYCMQHVMEGFREHVEHIDEPIERLRAFIHNHLSFFVANMREMKVLSHEPESLSGERADELWDMKREYYRALREIVRALPGRERDESELRNTTMSIFGMLNWVYNWYRPQRDGSVDGLAETMGNLVIREVAGPSPR
jgi:AcrR family transcriptional regulator